MRPSAPVLLVALVVACGGGSAHASTSAEPTLRIADASPLTLSGSRFKARETIRLRVTTASAKRLRTVRAGARGSFRAVFTGVTLDRCSGLRVSAVGARGSRASLSLLRIAVCGDD